MARGGPIDKNGLNWQQEKFCRFFVNEYANKGDDDTETDIAVEAYRRAYNCQSTAKEKSHREAVSRLMNNIKITSRISELRKGLCEHVGIECADIVSRNVKALNVDPLMLTIFDKNINRWRLRFMHEIPKNIRNVIPYKINNKGIVVPDIDRNKIMDRLIDVLGFKSANEIKVNMAGNLGSELTLLDEHDIFED